MAVADTPEREACRADHDPPEAGPAASARIAAIAGQQRADRQQAAVLGFGVGGLMLVCAALLAGWPGAVGALLATALIRRFGSRLPPGLTMRLYRAAPLDPTHSDKLYRILGLLCGRASLAATPRLHVIPSLTLNAFAAGRDGNAAIAVTEGLLRRLTMREISGVLAHEVAHIKRGDLAIMGLADVIVRLTQLMAWLGLGLLLLQIPWFLSGQHGASWPAIALLCLAPALASLLQRGLSRAREYEADVGAVELTGDALGLASALSRIEQSHGRLIEDVVPPYGRRITQPSLLRSHPPSEERIARLRELAARGDLPTFTTREEPMVSLAGLGPISMRARYHFPGVWY